MNRKSDDLLQSHNPLRFEEHYTSVAAIAVVSAIMTLAALAGVLVAL